MVYGFNKTKITSHPLYKMQNFITALKAEHLKKKGTGVYVLSIILAAISPIIFTIIKFFEDGKFGPQQQYSFYLQLFKDSVEPFANFFFPLLIIITVSRITQLDHRNGGWQLMETQPLRKLNIYLSKFTVVLISNLIAVITLAVVSYLGAWIASLFIDMPKDATTDLEIGEAIGIMARLYIGSLFLTAFQYLISVLMPSFIWSILIGFFLLLLYIFLSAFKVVPDWYPIELISNVSEHIEGSQLGYWLTYSEAVSLLCSVIALYIGFEWYRHKGIKRAFFGKTFRALKLAAVLIVAGGLLVYMLIPNQMEPHNRTVLAGKIEGDSQINTIYVTDNFIQDTVAVIPVKNNEFHFVLKETPGLDDYRVTFDGKFKSDVTFGTNDSIYFDLKTNKENVSGDVTGTRIAENQYKKEAFKGGTASYYVQDNMFMDQPSIIMGQIVSDWKDDMNESDKFKTVDNYIPREDFKEKNGVLLTIYHLNVWHEFRKKREVMYPGEETKASDDIKEMIKKVPLDDVGLLSNQDYFNYVRSQLIENNKEDLDENTKALVAIAKLKDGAFKDRMLYWQLNESIKDASTGEERVQLISQYGNKFKDSKYLAYTQANNKLIESLSKGMPAPLFDATSLDGRKFDLAELKGKHVVIDVWATWCAPCREQSPKFEKLAIKYKNEPVQFVALSTDRRIDKWLIDAKTKSKSVLQLHIDNEGKFSREYDIQFIPRFILIDPQGNFINSQMPYPDDKVFEKLLRESLGLAEEK
jgi:thiol-disulfide isomerase/thioredoxin